MVVINSTLSARLSLYAGHVMMMGLLLRIISNIKIPNQLSHILSNNRQKRDSFSLLKIPEFGRAWQCMPNLCKWEAEAGRSGAQGQPGLHSKFQANLSHISQMLL